MKYQFDNFNTLTNIIIFSSISYSYTSVFLCIPVVPQCDHIIIYIYGHSLDNTGIVLFPSNLYRTPYSGTPRIGAGAYRGRSLGICFFRFKNNPAYRGAIHLTGHSTDDFFHLSNMLYTFVQLSILCNGR